MPQELEIRVAILEEGHKELGHRADIMEAMLKEMRAEQSDMRQDVKDDLSRLQTSMHRIETASLQTWPPAAVQALQQSASREVQGSHLRGILIGAVVSLIVAVGAMAVDIGLH